MAFDRRLTPARTDLAADHLRGQVEAARFVAGTRRRVIETAIALRREPDPACGIDTEAIYGEEVMVYDEVEGWTWGQLARDGYVGWMSAEGLGMPLAATHRVTALRSFIYPVPSIKQPPLTALTLGSELALERQEGLFLAVAGGGFVFARHVAPLGTIEHDPVAVAERFLGVPYLWGGKTSLGLDCSALVQTALYACGTPFARDSDLQEREAGESIDPAAGLQAFRRGDLLFWKGHVALVRDAETMIHATGHTMTVTIEGLAEGIARIAAAGDALRSVKRLGARVASPAPV